MDNKTLEYMGERVDKARKLQERIKETQKRIDILLKDELSSVNFSINNSSVFFIKNKAQLNDIKAATINALENYRDSLQHELDEL